MAAVLATAISGCGARPGPSAAIRRLISQARPVGTGPRFHPAVHGPSPRRCAPRLGPRVPAHVEVFAGDRVVILPAGIGLRHGRTLDGAIIAARCFGPIVTLDPTGVVLTAPGSRTTLADLFSAWGLPLSTTRLAGFTAPSGSTVRAYVDGRRRPGGPRRILITRRAEIVLEVGPYVPPHSEYAFSPIPRTLPDR